MCLLFFFCCDKIPKRNNLREEPTCFWFIEGRAWGSISDHGSERVLRGYRITTDLIPECSKYQGPDQV